MGSFKPGDNIVHNFSILRILYATQASDAESCKLLRKPIIVLIGSIAEAILYDLYMVKIQIFTREGVPTIPDAVLEEIRNKTIDEFAKYISNARSKKLLGDAPKIYDKLDELRKLRNRIHIQNTKQHFDPDEPKTYNRRRQEMAEETLEELISYMVDNYSRSKGRQSVADFDLPWKTRIESNTAG